MTALPSASKRRNRTEPNRSKRRCDVAGQYGPQGFMLLLPQTPPEGAVHFCRRLQGLLDDVPPTDVFPNASAGATFHDAITSGKFHGMICAHTPTGSRRV